MYKVVMIFPNERNRGSFKAEIQNRAKTSKKLSSKVGKMKVEASSEERRNNFQNRTLKKLITFECFDRFASYLEGSCIRIKRFRYYPGSVIRLLGIEE